MDNWNNACRGWRVITSIGVEYMRLALHHIGILVKDINKSASEHVCRYDSTIMSPIIHDPVQTAYVQFLQVQDETNYIEFVSPDGKDSKLHNALQKGGGLNHLCYSVADIDLTSKELQDKGMFLLQKPVEAVAFHGRRIAWLMGRDGIPLELIERGRDEWEIK